MGVRPISNKAIDKNLNKSYYLRIIAGGYFLYLVYGLLGDYQKGASTNKLLIIGSIVIFFMAGSLLIYSSIKYLLNHREGANTDVDEEVNEDNN